MKIEVEYSYDNQTDTYYIKFISTETNKFIVNNQYGINCICYDSDKIGEFENSIHSATNNVPINFREFMISLSRKDVDKTENIVNFVKSKIKQRLEHEKTLLKYRECVLEKFDL